MPQGRSDLAAQGAAVHCFTGLPALPSHELSGMHAGAQSAVGLVQDICQQIYINAVIFQRQIAVDVTRTAVRAMLQAMAMSGKQQFPFMVDPNNNNRELLESDAIIKYLYDEYGDGNVTACLWH